MFWQKPSAKRERLVVYARLKFNGKFHTACFLDIMQETGLFNEI
jgi:hypothetical protein